MTPYYSLAGTIEWLPLCTIHTRDSKSFRYIVNVLILQVMDDFVKEILLKKQSIVTNGMPYNIYT